jgi:hypothetical protein
MARSRAVLTLDQVESGRALGNGAKTDKPLELVPLICVGVASKNLTYDSGWTPMADRCFQFSRSSV